LRDEPEIHARRLSESQAFARQNAGNENGENPQASCIRENRATGLPIAPVQRSMLSTVGGVRSSDIRARGSHGARRSIRPVDARPAVRMNCLRRNFEGQNGYAAQVKTPVSGALEILVGWR
jgi:hypothetical protein